MADAQTTTLNKANNNSESLRTTVPSFIVKHFELEEGDGLGWDFVIDKKNEQIVVVRPRKNEEKVNGKQ